MLGDGDWCDPVAVSAVPLIAHGQVIIAHSFYKTLADHSAISQNRYRTAHCLLHELESFVLAKFLCMRCSLGNNCWW